jgi:chromosome partitioning protein
MQQTVIAAFLNQKGGVGKTTSVVNIGAGLTILGKRVLIVDLDPQGHLTTFLGIDANEFDKTIYEMLRGEAKPREALIERELNARFSIDDQDSRLTLSVIPSDSNFNDGEMVLSRLPNREFLLKTALEMIQDEYDYILIDCPPSLGLLATNALVASQKVFVPVQTEYLALQSVENLQAAIESVATRFNPELEIGGMIATRFDGRKVLNRAVVEDLKERFGALLLETMIRENIVLAEAPKFGKDIFSYRPRSYGAADYLNLCLEITNSIRGDSSPVSIEHGVARQEKNVAM